MPGGLRSVGDPSTDPRGGKAEPSPVTSWDARPVFDWQLLAGPERQATTQAGRLAAFDGDRPARGGSPVS